MDISYNGLVVVRCETAVLRQQSICCRNCHITERWNQRGHNDMHNSCHVYYVEARMVINMGEKQHQYFWQDKQQNTSNKLHNT